MGNSMRLMLAGNYVKYVDDFRSAIVGWKSNWLTLTCEKHSFNSREMKADEQKVLLISKRLCRCLTSI
jgi:hypothetical protein